jgi:uncharacterized protein YeaO (DUF488 family)
MRHRDRGRRRHRLTASVKGKRVYEPPAASDGLRILVMRLWPRGIKKTAVDLWLKELGADVANIRAWKAGQLAWPEMRRRYLAGLKRPAAAEQLAELKAHSRQRPVTLLCSCEDEARCHRGILKSLLEKPSALKPRRHAAP